MKRLFLILVCLWLTGCVSSTIRGVNKEKNIFYSNNNPNIQIQLPSNYSYREGGKGNMQHHFYKGDHHVFLHFRPKIVNEAWVDYYYNPESWLFNHILLNEKINTGTLKILDKKWYYCNSLQKFESECYFVRDLGYFTQNHSVLDVRFLRKLSYDDCQILENREFLTSKQYELMQDIIESFEKEIEFTSFIAGADDKPVAVSVQTTFSVESNIIAAKVFVDSVQYGITPLENVFIWPGQHKILVKKTGYEVYRKTINVKEGGSVSLYVDLIPK
jgi:hypothetical protein